MLFGVMVKDFNTPNPVAVPELVIVAPDGIVIVSPDAPRVKDVPVLG